MNMNSKYRWRGHNKSYYFAALLLVLETLPQSAWADCRSDWSSSVWTYSCSPIAGVTRGELVLSGITSAGSCNQTISFSMPSQGGLQQVASATSCRGNPLTWAGANAAQFSGPGTLPTPVASVCGGNPPSQTLRSDLKGMTEPFQNHDSWCRSVGYDGARQSDRACFKC